MRVPQYLSDQQVAFETLIHPPTYSAQKLAQSLRVPGKLVAKTVLVRGPEGYILAVLPATHQLDTEALEKALGGPVQIAKDEEIASVFRDCEWGVVEPFGKLYGGLPTIIDDSLTPDTWVIFEAHTHAEAIKMRCADFERLEQPRRLPISHASA
jgi:Ala-tRNA(Pro) deacylase